MLLYEDQDHYIAVQLHAWRCPMVWRVFMPFDWRETMTCFGFGTLHYERRVPASFSSALFCEAPGCKSPAAFANADGRWCPEHLVDLKEVPE
jgi:hypothetical protein